MNYIRRPFFGPIPARLQACEIERATTVWKLFPISTPPPDALAHNTRSLRAINTICDAGPIQAHAAACAATRRS